MNTSGMLVAGLKVECDSRVEGYDKFPNFHEREWGGGGVDHPFIIR